MIIDYVDLLLPFALFKVILELFLYRNFSLLIKYSSKYRLTVSPLLKLWQFKEFCKYRKKWKCEGAIVGDYSGEGYSSQLICNIFLWICKEVCGLILSWWNLYDLLPNKHPGAKSNLFLALIVLLMIYKTFYNNAQLYCGYRD